MRYKGTPPKEPCELLADVDIDGATWELWERLDRSNERWRSLKLIVTGQPRAKANYWIGYDTREGTLTRVRDASLLKDHCPAVYEWCEDILANTPRPEPVTRDPRAPKPQPVLIRRELKPTPAQIALGALYRLRQARGEAAEAELLALFGASRLAEVPSELWPAVAEAAESLLR